MTAVSALSIRHGGSRKAGEVASLAQLGDSQIDGAGARLAVAFVVAVDWGEPLRLHLAGSLPKLHGLARYAEANGYMFGRIVAVSEVHGGYRRPYLKKLECETSSVPRSSHPSHANLRTITMDHDGQADTDANPVPLHLSSKNPGNLPKEDGA
jgi:hypothetical protein